MKIWTRPDTITENGKPTKGMSAFTDQELLDAISFLAQSIRSMKHSLKFEEIQNSPRKWSVNFQTDIILANSLPLINEIKRRQL